jgi:KUP system potassium uptake protein
MMTLNGTASATPSPAVRHSRLLALSLGSLGVVYGDIGTSPLYAFREAITAAGGSADGVDPDAVLSVLSLILWALILIVTVKYVLVLLRADNNGEGGTLTLMGLAQRAIGRNTPVIFLLGVISAALFYGDAVITPAISVLSAIEGLKLATPTIEPYIVPITLVILVALFLAQSKGTEKVSALFGPIMTVWFVAIALPGFYYIAVNPGILAAINPFYGVSFLLSHGKVAFITLGAVFLAVTGAEALYADLGHFGRRPIQLAWVAVVLPSLAINYFGQGAMVLAYPKGIENPFFLMYPDWALLPMVALATAATIIASQAVITGAYSITRQAIQLGLLPRLEVRHTSETLEGQIYMPRVNTVLLLAVVLLVGLFRSSDALAGAYGIAVSGTMVVTAMMAFIVIWRGWGWPLAGACALIVPFIAIDVSFFLANSMKIFAGGWMPLALAFLVILVMYTWRTGSQILFEKTRKQELPLVKLVEMLEAKPPQRVPGTAVFLTSDPKSAPTALLHSLKHYKVLHEKNVILTVRAEDVPRVAPESRVEIEQISETFSCVRLRFGFMEIPNVPRALVIARTLGWQFDIMSTSFFLSRRTLRPAARSDMPMWQDHMFILLTRVANDATDYFRIPTDRVVEVGTQITV